MTKHESPTRIFLVSFMYHHIYLFTIDIYIHVFKLCCDNFYSLSFLLFTLQLNTQCFSHFTQHHLLFKPILKHVLCTWEVIRWVEHIVRVCGVYFSASLTVPVRSYLIEAVMDKMQRRHATDSMQSQYWHGFPG